MMYCLGTGISVIFIILMLVMLDIYISTKLTIDVTVF